MFKTNQVLKKFKETPERKVGFQLMKPNYPQRGSAKNLNFLKIPIWEECRNFEA